jgi:hypothetical protein
MRKILFIGTRLISTVDTPLGSRLALLHLLSTAFDPGSPVALFADEWEKWLSRLYMIKQFHPENKLLNAHLQPVGSQLVSLEEVEFLPPAVVLHAIYHYFWMKWTDFHGSMQRRVCLNPKHDAPLIQQDFFQKLSAVWRISNFSTHIDLNSRSTN